MSIVFFRLHEAFRVLERGTTRPFPETSYEGRPECTTGRDGGAFPRALRDGLPPAFAICLAISIGIARADIDVASSVLTRHNDPQRTGWYQTESLLSPATVTPTTFGEVARLHVGE